MREGEREAVGDVNLPIPRVKATINRGVSRAFRKIPAIISKLRRHLMPSILFSNSMWNGLSGSVTLLLSYINDISN